MQTHLEVYTGKLTMPIVGYGTWLSDNPEELQAGLETALQVGYRHFDTAYMYGSEKVVGKVLNNWMKSADGNRRQDLFVTTKLPIQGCHPDRVGPFLDASLQNLQLDYVDLYLIHNPAGVQASPESGILFDSNGLAVLDTEHILEETWTAMEEQVRNGKTKAIGLSNVGTSQVERIAKFGSIKPANVQVELNVSYPKKGLRKLCEKYGIGITAFAPLGSPGRTQAYGNNQRLQVPDLLNNPAVQKVGDKYGKSPAQILLKFLIQNGVAVIPKSVHPARIEENFNLFAFELDAESLISLEELDSGQSGSWGWDWVNYLPGLNTHPEFQQDVLED